MFNIIEPFNISGGNTTNLKSDTKINKSFEQDQNINRSMAVNSITKLMQNVSNEVIQNNSASASSAVSASNTINIANVNCDDVVVTGINQKSSVVSQTQMKSSQTNTNKISTEISTNINKTVEKQGGTDLAKLQADNTKQLNDFMNAMPGHDPKAAQKLADQCPKPPPEKKGFFSSLIPSISVGNTCNASSSYELNASVKQALHLDESFKIDDTDDLSSDVKNTINQANFASCAASAAANNAININNIMCGAMSAAAKSKEKALVDAGEKKAPAKRGKLEISDIEQTAVAQLFMTCIFDQKNTNEIATKLATSIEKKYSQMYDAVEAKLKGKTPEEEKKMKDFLKAYVGAGYEKLNAAAGVLPERAPTKNDTTKVPENKVPENKNTSDTKTVGSDILAPMPAPMPVNFDTPKKEKPKTTTPVDSPQPVAQAVAQPVVQPVVQPVAQANTQGIAQLNNNTILYIAGGASILLVLVLIIIFVKTRKNN